MDITKRIKMDIEKVTGNSFGGDLNAMYRSIRILKIDNPKMYRVFESQFNLTGLYEKIGEILDYGEKWDKKTNEEKDFIYNVIMKDDINL